jgi:hypothetical protein
MRTTLIVCLHEAVSVSVFIHIFFVFCSCCIKFVHEEALACELAAYFYLELGEINKSVEYFLLAYERYNEWGAFEKAESLFKFAKSILTPASTNVGVGL